MTDEQKAKGWFSASLAIFLGIVVMGVALRCAQYAWPREFWSDEAYLALDVSAMSYRELMGQLHYNMVFPIGFLFALKFISTTLGTSEYAFRLISIIGGVLSMFLFAGLAVRVRGYFKNEDSCAPYSRRSSVDWSSTICAAAFFALSKHAVYYSSELRHYSIDLAVVCLLFLIALSPSKTSASATPRTSRVIAFSIAGAVLTWFSLASAFVLAAVAVTDLAACASNKKWRAMFGCVALHGLWICSFGAHMFLLNKIMSLGERSSSILAHVASMSPPFPPTNMAGLHLWREALEHFFQFPGGFSDFLAPGIVCVVGALALWKTKPRAFAIFFLPVLFVIGASALHRYPFRNQYLLFLLPTLYIFMGVGISRFTQNSDWLLNVAGFILLLAIIIHPAREGVRVLSGQYRCGPGSNSIIRPLLEYAKDRWTPGDLFVVRETQEAVFRWYAPEFGFIKTGLTDDKSPLLYATLINSPHSYERNRRIWILQAVKEPQIPKNYIVDLRRRLDATRTENAELLLYENGPGEQ
jgi:uncharacterized membrane protein